MDKPTRGAAVVADPFPTVWNVVRESTNPVINVANNPNETAEQYVPAAIQLGNGDVWVYVKGAHTIYAWKSTDGGVTFALQNSNNPVINIGGVGTWDHGSVVEPCAVYDSANSTIHLWYKGTDDATGATDWGWGHATAPDSTPTVFTKDAGNPIISNSSGNTQLGGAGLTDFAVSDVVKIGSTYHFYGYALYNSVYRIVHATGTSWNDPGSLSVITSAPSDWRTVIQGPCVFTYGSLYGMFYALGGTQPSFTRAIFVGSSTDGSTWNFQGGEILGPVGTGWELLETYLGRVVKTSTSPFSAPVTDTSGRWHFYYSGYDGSKANVGLAYLTPS